MGDPNGPGFQAPFQSLPDSLQEDLSGGREEEGKAQDIRKDSGRKKESPSEKNGRSVQEGAAGEVAPGQFSLELPDGSKAFQTSQGSTGCTGDDHQADGGQDPNHLPQLNQDEQLQEGDTDKEQEEAAQKRHGERYPLWNKKGPAGSRSTGNGAKGWPKETVLWKRHISGAVWG
jgi:hypothetical protein